MAEQDRIALFIDGANLYATAKSLGFDIDYKRLLKEFQSRGKLVRAYYYTALVEDQEYSSIRPLVDWLDYNGYSVGDEADERIRRFARPPQGQGRYGHRTRRGRDGDGRPSRPHRTVLRRRRLPLGWWRRCRERACAFRSSRRMRPSRRWSPTNCAARPTNSSTSSISPPKSAAIPASAPSVPIGGRIGGRLRPSNSSTRNWRTIIWSERKRS